MARRVLMAEVGGGRARETKVRQDGWCEGGLRQHRNDGADRELPALIFRNWVHFKQIYI